MSRRVWLLCALLSMAANFIALHAGAAEAAKYHLLARYLIGGSELSYDYLRVDPATRYLYVAHANRVEVLNADSGARVGEIAGTHGVHGIEIVPALNQGFTSNGIDRTVTVFDARTLQILKIIPGMGIKPDAIQYDDDTQKLFVVNGGATGDVSVIEPKAGVITATVSLGGNKLEQIAFDGRGHAFVNDEGRNVIHVFDTHTLKPLAVWPIAPGEAPTGLAIDRVRHRLFAACGNHKLIVVDSDTGQVIATPMIGEDPDGAVFDATSDLIYTSNKEGTLSILHEDSPTKFSTVQTLKTEVGARTLALDPNTGHVFLPTAKTIAGGKALQPDTFVVLVVGK